MNFLNKNILKLALPSILANITIPIVGMVDIAIAGHLDSMSGESAMMIGGITIGSMIFDLLYWSFGFLRAGTGGLTAQAYGRKDFKSAADTFARSACIAVVSSLFLIAIQWIVVQLVFAIVVCSPETQALATQYFYTRIWAAPAALTLMAIKGWFIGMQDTVSSMLTDLTVVGVNVVASLLLAFGFGAGIGSGVGVGAGAGVGAGIGSGIGSGFGSWEGIGYLGIPVGTVIAQYAGLLLAVLIIRKKYFSAVFQHYTLRHALRVFYNPGTKLFFKTNGDLFVRSLCFAGVYMGFTTLSARYGDMALASSAIIMKLMLFFSYFTDGFAYAGEAMTGRFFGEENPVLIRRTIKTTFAWSMSIAGLFVLINGVFAYPLFNMMTSDAAIVDFSGQFIIWMLLVPIFGCPAFVWDGIFVGATYTKEMRNSAILSVVAFYIVWFGLGLPLGVVQETGAVNEVPALHLLLLAYTAHLLVRAVYQTAVYAQKKGAFQVLSHK